MMLWRKTFEIDGLVGVVLGCAKLWKENAI